ncbi:MAG: ribosome maturation factor RimM [Saprospiraceae bacterium]|nr:ribosome maturation factor RimM [Saprospiraceae bacterium]
MEYIEIGKIHKAHGLKGELKIRVDDVFIEELGNLEVLFLGKTKGEKIPYFVESIRGSQDLILKLEEIDQREDATLLMHQLIFARRTDIQLSDEAIEEGLSDLVYGYLVAYCMEDLTLGKIGEIVGIEEFPQQEMAVIKLYDQEQEVFIPLTEQWIKEIDKLNKKVVMELPEGLLDL